MHINIASVIKSAKTVVTANSPVLLVGTAVAGVVATGYLAARAGAQARDIIETEQESRELPLEPIDKVKLTWLCFAPPALSAASTIASVVGVHVIHTRRYAALSALYAMTTHKLDSLSEEAEKLLGPKKSEAMHAKVAQDTFDACQADSFEDNSVVLTNLQLPEGKVLFWDDYSGRPYAGSVNNAEAAINTLNAMLVSKDAVSLNDWYNQIGLQPTTLGEEFGWSGGDMIEKRFDSIRVGLDTENPTTATTVTFRPSPTTEYNSNHRTR